MAKQVPNELITAKEQSTDNQFLQIEPLIRTIRGQQVLEEVGRCRWWLWSQGAGQQARTHRKAPPAQKVHRC